MKRRIRKAAVLGAGVMGSKIAAHLANAGIPCLLLDIVPTELTAGEQKKGLTLESPEVRNRIARQGLENAKKADPPAFFVPEAADLISIGNFEDDMAKISEADWIIEAVIENLAIKRQVFERVERFRKAEAIVSSNTSGLSIRALCEGRTGDFRRHFLGTHFFNPPRYMRLLEVIPTAETDPEVVEFICDFCDRTLGKGVLICKDTPNFIANRIGIFASMCAIKVMLEEGYSIEEIDQMTGTILGRPKTATFRLKDLVGIDTFAHVAENLYENAPEDESREVFRLPEFIRRMIQNGWLGDKAGQGFYKKIKKDDTTEILALDYRTLEYRPLQRANLPEIEMAKGIEDLRERIRALVYGENRVGRFLWRTLSATLLYAARHLLEIADSILDVDRAFKWGFNWKLGLFETWDAIGLQRSVARMCSEGKQIPEWIEKMVSQGRGSFYSERNGQTYCYDLKLGDYKRIEERPGILLLSSLKARNKVVKRNAGASLIDLGDGVLCLEFHSKMNAIGPDAVQMMNAAVQELERNFDALLVGNQGENFSAGANLMLLLLEAQEGNWEEIDLAVRAFQNANMALKYACKPVVAAPFGTTLGGGCEICLHATRQRAAAETYMGLVETSVGLIPAGGGTKELLLRHLELISEGSEVDPFPYVKRAFETIAMAKVSTSALDARKLGYLRQSDPITMNPDRLIADAKQTALALARDGFLPSRPRSDILVLGESALAALKVSIHIMKRAGHITEYDAHIAAKLAHVLTGGNLSHPARVSEQYLLDLEREAFLSLCGERKTQERMLHMLRTGKPLRN